MNLSVMGEVVQMVSERNQELELGWKWEKAATLITGVSLQKLTVYFLSPDWAGFLVNPSEE